MVASEYNSPQAILDNLHSAVIVIGENLQVMCINPAAEMLFHISNTRATKKNIRDLIINEDSFFERLERSLVSAHPYTVYDDQLQVHNNNTIDVDYSVSPILYSNTGKHLLLEFIRLKTHNKLTHDENIFNQYEAGKSLLRGLAHEIKNPLGGIRGSAQLLERELDSDHLRQFTNIIINETDRLKNLLDRMVGPKDMPTKTEINIHKVLEHIRKLLLAENEHIKVTVDYDPSIPEIYADESMMVQIMLNISRNALREIKTLDNGLINLKTRALLNCKIGAKTYPLAAKIDIEDNGAGVAKNLKEKIFMPMITGHAEGAGLGLSIAQSLAQQHDGLIEFSSRPGKTVFTTLLPIKTQVEISKKTH